MTHKRHGRREPYTEIGISRLPCYRCGQPATASWTICADGNLHRPICRACDVELNETVLKFMGFSDWRQKIKAYAGAAS